MLKNRAGKTSYGSSGVWEDFEIAHINQVFDLLEEKFGFPMRSTANSPRNWKLEFKHYFEKQPHSISETSSFMTFGNREINPVLNKILLRPEQHGTFVNLVEYVIKNSAAYKIKLSDKVNERKKYQG